MSKPLELTVHPRRYVLLNGRAGAKRLTTSELSAEYWHSWNLFKTGSHERRDWTEYDRSIILRRFATTPSYDEVTA